MGLTRSIKNDIKKATQLKAKSIIVKFITRINVELKQASTLKADLEEKRIAYSNAIEVLHGNMVALQKFRDSISVS